MTIPSPTDRAPALRAELHWLIRLRWAAGTTVLAGVAANALWIGWQVNHALLLAIGVVILCYNAAFWVVFRSGATRSASRRWLVGAALSQIALDLLCLTTMTVWTGGLASPLLGLFVLHMVFASLLLPPLVSFGGVPAAVAMLLVALWMTSQWPADREPVLLLLGWALTLALTVYLANHITGELRRRETALRRHHRRTRAILETAADGIVTLDEHLRMQSMNPAAERMFGCDARDLIDRPLTMLVPKLAAPPSAQALAGLLERHSPPWSSAGTELSGRRFDGTEFPIEIAASSLRIAGRTNLTLIIRDITEHKESEAALQRLNDELRRQQQALVQHEKMAAMGQMAAGVTHEISNPLANMDSVLQLIQRQPNRMSAETFTILRKQVERIRRTIHQMKYFAHPHESCWEMIDVNEAVMMALEMVRFDHRIRAVEVQQNLSADAGQMRLMPHAIQQVMVNLLLNAMDALSQAREPRLAVSTMREGSSCLIAVEDNGRGIEVEHLPHIFEPFFTTKPVGEGTGLGLSISYSLVERLGGSIDVSSAPGVGTVFTVRLPVTEEDSRQREGAD